MERMDTTYDALVVVSDIRENSKSSIFTKELSHRFEKQKLLYLIEAMNAEDLYGQIKDKIKNQELVLPRSERIVFCNYLDLKDFSVKWVDRHLNFMKRFKELVSVEDGLQHYYITFLRYRTIEPLDEKKDDIFQAFEYLKDIQMPMRHGEFLVYEGGFDCLDLQEKGMACLLYILSAKGYLSVYKPQDYKRGLYILNYSDYCEKRALQYQRKWKEIKDWLEKTRDPNRVEFYRILKTEAESAAKMYQEEMEKFQRWIGLYPVRVSDYTSQGFWLFKKYKRRNKQYPELEKEKLRYQENLIAVLQNSSAKARWIQDVFEQMNYQDYVALKEAWERGEIVKEIRQNLQMVFRELDELDAEKFLNVFQEWVRELMSQIEEKMEKEKQDRKNQKSQLEAEMRLTSQYKDLKDCFLHIRDQVRFRVPKVIIPALVGETAIINGTVADHWTEKNYQIQGIENEKITVSGSNTSYEIQYLKMGKYVSWDTNAELERLKQVLN